MLNNVVIMGRLCKDVEMRRTQSGTPVASFTLAVDRPTSKDTADFPTIVAWRDTAVFVSKYLSKGRRIVVHGSIRTRNFEDKDGNHRKATEVQAERIEFADSKPAGADG